MKLLWLDLETTGLDPKRDIILEVACGLVDFNTPFNLVHPLLISVLPMDYNSWEPVMKPAVINMHHKNNLFRECQDRFNQTVGVGSAIPYTRQLHRIEDTIMDAIDSVDHDDIDSMPILAGSTIGFDMGFLKQHMPNLAENLSYRLYDITTLKLICRSLGMDKIPKKEAHRAWEDVQESVAHGKQCVEWLNGRKDLLANISRNT